MENIMRLLISERPDKCMRAQGVWHSSQFSVSVSSGSMMLRQAHISHFALAVGGGEVGGPSAKGRDDAGGAVGGDLQSNFSKLFCCFFPHLREPVFWGVAASMILTSVSKELEGVCIAAQCSASSV
jgi:hypothetical protein